jgi:hypothetical protein
MIADLCNSESGLRTLGDPDDLVLADKISEILPRLMKAAGVVMRYQDLKFISENQKLSGFPGRLNKRVVAHKPDMKKIAESAKHLNAQTPSSLKGMKTKN